MNEQPSFDEDNEGMELNSDAGSTEKPLDESVAVPEDIIDLNKVAAKVRAELQKVIVGQEDLMDYLLISLLTKGHVLLEGVPGIAKTLMASMFARTINVDFGRLQFTPDLMPSDVIGTNIFNMKTSDFQFRKGPLFTDVLLIDEINRAPAKTQSALFEVMQERQATVDGVTYPMSDSYMVIATQNPIDQEGTYKLPEAQLDRFLFRIILEHPSLENEVLILHRFKEDFSGRQSDNVRPVIEREQINRFQKAVEMVAIKDDILEYIAGIVDGTRHNGDIYLGASPRASLAIMKASKAKAALSGRNFVTPDDVRDVTYFVLNHRIILAPERELEGVSVRSVVDEVIRNVEVPR